jgi:hypothetical protein
MMRVTFDGVFADGLHPITGHAFEFGGRAYVVHKGREPYEQDYWVTEPSTGLKVEIARTHNRAVAIELAKQELAKLTETELSRALKRASRSRLKAAQVKK